ncbi:MAG: hypothetical protein Q8N39_02170 [Pelolinea sp.]|nr:hypothetical protein [Pelolinea sp.]
MKNRILTFIQIVLPLLFFLVIFIPREVVLLKTISVLVRYNTSRFIFIASLLLFLTLIIKKRWVSNLAAAIVIYSLFALSLVGLWASAYSENYVIAGLLPRSDAFYTYTGAIHLMEKGYLNGFTSRRPIFGGLLGFVLWLFGGNLQFALITLTLFSATACYFFTIEVKRFLSPLAAVALFIVQFLFVRRFIGITMSENIGYILGAVSMTLFLIMLRTFEVNRKRAWIYFFLGVLMITLAQAARPGAITTLPLLILFALWVSRIKKKVIWGKVILTILVIGLGFLLNLLLFRITSKENTTQTNNIGYGVYGLAVGGKGWEQIFFDHPEVNTLPTGERESRIMQIVLTEISQHPENLIKGLGYQFSVLFSFQPTNSLFSFVNSSHPGFTIILMAALFFLGGLGIIACILKRSQPFYQMMLVFLGGFATSLVFAPAYQTQYMRVYAASIPLLALIPAVGLENTLEWSDKRFHVLKRINPNKDDRVSITFIIFSLSLTPIIFFGPIVMKLFAGFKGLDPIGCDPGKQEAVIDFLPGTSVTIFENTPDKMTWVPNVSQFDYRRDIHSICCDDEVQYFENLLTSGTLYPAVNLLDGRGLYLVAQIGQLPESRGTIRVCGKMEDVLGDPSGRDILYSFEIEEYKPH